MMDSSRSVEITGRTEGTGWLVTPGLVLTAWHILKRRRELSSPEMVPLRIHKEKQTSGLMGLETRTGQILWPPPGSSADADFALLATSGPSEPEDHPVKWRKGPSSRTLRIEGIGFSSTSSLSSAGKRDLRTLKGTAYFGAPRTEGLTFDIVFDSDAQADEGCVGAALFHDEQLVGIITGAASSLFVVTLPNDDTKGYIDGPGKRNIEAIKTATGVGIIIDDTPGVITVRSSDPIRREIARNRPPCRARGQKIRHRRRAARADWWLCGGDAAQR
jgi:hypothetical protein